MTFNFTSPRLVLAGTVYGEARGGGVSGMADVAAVVLNRVRAGWSGGTIPSVCLAPYQFSCWLGGADPNRDAILAAYSLNDATWQQALDVADAAMTGAADKTGGADSYFAVSIAPPYWAAPPAKHTVTRWLHSFWMTRPGKPVATISAHSSSASSGTLHAGMGARPTPVTSAAMSTAALNEAELAGTLPAANGAE